MIPHRYTDSDGDILCIVYEPLEDDPEDIWIGISMNGRSAAVRIPFGALQGILSEIKTEVSP